jgi:threonine/homoserine/homoserine lactone efflux protein
MSLIVGPITVIFIRQTLSIGIKAALVVTAGTLLGDAFYAGVALAGLAIVIDFLKDYADILQKAGGLLLLYLAYNEFSSPASISTYDKTPVASGVFNPYALSIKVFLLTLTSPVTLISFMGVFSSIGDTDLTWLESLSMFLGVMIGITAFWILLGWLLLRYKNRFSALWIDRMRYISAGILTVGGILALVIQQ